MPSNSTAILPHTGRGARASRVGTSPHTAVIRKRTQETFGVDVNQFGNLTPTQVRNMSISAQRAKEQLEMLSVYLAAAKERGAAEAEVEKMRADFLKDSAATLKTLDKTFQGAVLLNARHAQNMKQIAAGTGQYLAEIEHDGAQRLTEGERRFAEKLKASKRLHLERLKTTGADIQTEAAAQLLEMRDRPLQLQRAETARVQGEAERANWMGFIKGKKKATLPTSKKNFGGWFK